MLQEITVIDTDSGICMAGREDGCSLFYPILIFSNWEAVRRLGESLIEMYENANPLPACVSSFMEELNNKGG